MQTYRIRIYGIVQGVGFRPFIYRLAVRLKLRGIVKNLGSFVEITLSCDNDCKITEFVKLIRAESPANALINDIFTKQIPRQHFKDFRIVSSEESTEFSYATLPRDLAICESCSREFHNPRDRRHFYGFINCMHCGPRYSIIKSLPYDRERTAMSDFVMCEKCQAEYGDINDRRFHAQPNSCHKCGISMFLLDKNGVEIAASKRINAESVDSMDSTKSTHSADSTESPHLAIIKQVQKLLAKHKIIAFKGIGGFNLICNVESSVIARLRKAKNRPDKPFAIMFRDLAHIRRYFTLTRTQERLLTSPNAPILLLKNPKIPLPANLAPSLSTIGVILAYSPLHKLLFFGRKTPLIFTSANLSGEPIITEKAAVLGKIAHCLDYVLDFNREIVNPIDDSVLSLLGNHRVLFLRAARGYYPRSIKSKFYAKSCVLALGAHQKSQIAIFYHHNIIISPHIGDLESVESGEYFKRTIALMLGIFQLRAQIVLCDMHPQYYSHKIARNFGEKVLGIYHHRAHFYSALMDSEAGDCSEIVGVVFDGTGFGEDGKIWGGEIFRKNATKMVRIAHFKYFTILGNNDNMRDNYTIAFGILHSVLKERVLEAFGGQKARNLYSVFSHSLNCFQSSSVGRIFDFVAYFCGVERQTYEGQSGMIIESLYDTRIREKYDFAIEQSEIDIGAMIVGVWTDSRRGISAKIIASKFINTLVAIILDIALREKCPVVLSGGVFQNKTLCDRLIVAFRRHKIPLILPSEISPNDGGIALGQIGAFVAGDYHALKE